MFKQCPKVAWVRSNTNAICRFHDACQGDSDFNNKTYRIYILGDLFKTIVRVMGKGNRAYDYDFKDLYTTLNTAKADMIRSREVIKAKEPYVCNRSTTPRSARSYL